MPHEAVIGLEVHVQLASKTKLFCSCPVSFGEPPNSLTCPVCLGLPGVLPVLNHAVVKLALMVALATGCTVNQMNRFVRKNYFYPDLPKGFQISQLAQPFAEGGSLEIDTASHGNEQIRIDRMHLEEDSAKLFHAPDGQECEHSLIDYNRAGVPLLEIVSKPDMHTAEQAGAYLRSLHRLLRYLCVSEAIMEQGAFRCDANVSIRSGAVDEPGPKVELKNINSFRHVEMAIDFEIQRQRGLAGKGHVIMQETRQWNEKASETIAMRCKEETEDYRYFPEPDLAPVVIDAGLIEKTQELLPELPLEKRLRFIDTYGLPVYDAEILVQHRSLADYFERTIALGVAPKKVSNWIMGDVMRCLDDVQTIDSFVVTPSHLAELISLVDDGTISSKSAKVVFDEIIATSQYPLTIVKNNDKYLQISDEAALEAVINSVFKEYPREARDYKAGKTKLGGFFVGLIMNETGGNANPAVVNKLLRRKLNE